MNFIRAFLQYSNTVLMNNPLICLPDSLCTFLLHKQATKFIFNACNMEFIISRMITARILLNL